MTDKDKDHEADKRAAEKHTADEKAAADKAATEKRVEHEKSGTGHIDNQNQDPNHPANKTPARDPKAPGPDHIAGPVFSSDNLRTEQEKDAEGESMGVGPLTRSENSPGPAETMEDLGIGPRTPYPTGNPPPPSESITYGQGIKGVTDKAKAKPGDSSGSAGAAPKIGDKDKAYAADASTRHKEEPAAHKEK